MRFNLCPRCHVAWTLINGYSHFKCFDCKICYFPYYEYFELMDIIHVNDQLSWDLLNNRCNYINNVYNEGILYLPLLPFNITINRLKKLILFS